MESLLGRPLGAQEQGRGHCLPLPHHAVSLWGLPLDCTKDAWPKKVQEEVWTSEPNPISLSIEASG